MLSPTPLSPKSSRNLSTADLQSADTSEESPLEQLQKACSEMHFIDVSSLLSSFFLKQTLENNPTFSLNLLLDVAKQGLEKNDFQILSLLLEQTTLEGSSLFDLNAASSHHGTSLLSLALIENHLELIEVSTQKGANPTLPCHYIEGRTPLQIACSSQNFQMAMALLYPLEKEQQKQLIASTTETAPQTPLQLLQSHAYVSDSLLDLLTHPEEAIVFETFLRSVASSDPFSVETLLSAENLPHISQRLPWLDFHSLCGKTHEKVIPYLLSYKTAQNQMLISDELLMKWNEKRSLLFITLAHKAFQTSEALIKRAHQGSVLNLNDVVRERGSPAQGMTPLDLVCESLLFNRANQTQPSAQNMRIHRALFLALLSQGADVEKMQSIARFEDFFLLLCQNVDESSLLPAIDFISDLNTLQSSLVLSVQSRCADLCDKISQKLSAISEPAILPWMDEEGKHPIYYACTHFATLRTLLKHFPHWINLSSLHDGSSPLLYALLNKAPVECIDLLTQKGADLFQPNHQGQTPQQLLLQAHAGDSKLKKRFFLE